MAALPSAVPAKPEGGRPELRYESQTMLTPRVAGFLRQAQKDARLAELVKSADSYQALAELSKQVDTPATVAELRAAFAARNALVLAQQLIRRGIFDRLPLAPVPAIDEDLWERVATIDLSPVASQLVD